MYQENTIEKVSQLERECIRSFQNTKTDEIDSYTIDQLKLFLNITESARHQLLRDSKPLTNTDYIAILLALKGLNMSNIESYKQMKGKDLIREIRSIVYDPTRMMQASSPPATHSIENTSVPVSGKKQNLKQLTESSLCGTQENISSSIEENRIVIYS
jgi:hypothetical protein